LIAGLSGIELSGQGCGAGADSVLPSGSSGPSIRLKEGNEFDVLTDQQLKRCKSVRPGGNKAAFSARWRVHFPSLAFRN